MMTNSRRARFLSLLLLAAACNGATLTDSAALEGTASASGSYAFRRASDPPRTEVVDPVDAHWIATFTDDSYTVALRGPTRTFSETTATSSVTHEVWVRTLPSPFGGTVDGEWLDAARAANENNVADVLALAMQYVKGAPPLYEGSLQIAGDAKYGPLVDGERKEGSDFSDYLGITWLYPDGPSDPPERSQFHSLDCSGYLRMIWGYRHSFAGSPYADRLPLSLGMIGTALPRRAYMQYESAPGIVVIQNAGVQVTDFTRLQVGDLVFFDASVDDGTALDHVGVYLGPDSASPPKHRFLSSRKSINGPTLGDYNGKSVLDGSGLYARGFRAARRL